MHCGIHHVNKQPSLFAETCTAPGDRWSCYAGERKGGHN